MEEKNNMGKVLYLEDHLSEQEKQEREARVDLATRYDYARVIQGKIQEKDEEGAKRAASSQLERLTREESDAISKKAFADTKTPYLALFAKSIAEKQKKALDSLLVSDLPTYYGKEFEECVSDDIRDEVMKTYQSGETFGKVRKA